jgi:Na+-transporting methylmalonyl-CoA/oxaloacetate decarboxylase gamma subunit
MTSNLILALQITVIGMGLVFAAILLLWGLMALLVRLAPERGEQQAQSAPEDLKAEAERRRRAAAAAVAIALAQQAQIGEPHEFPLPPTALVSAWQAVLRTRMLYKRGPTRRGSSR